MNGEFLLENQTLRTIVLKKYKNLIKKVKIDMFDYNINRTMKEGKLCTEIKYQNADDYIFIEFDCSNIIGHSLTETRIVVQISYDDLYNIGICEIDYNPLNPELI